MRFSFGLLSLVALAVSAQDASLEMAKEAFEKANIPRDLSINFNPTALLQVTFPQSGSQPITISSGEQVPRASTAGPPIFSVVGNSTQGPFVIAVVDPDVPTPQFPIFAQFRHFLGGDFTRNGVVLTNSTPAISPYKQPSPPAGSDPHRYIFLLFNQPDGFDQQTLVTPATPAQSFRISTFAKKAGLGDPIAGTFMFVGPDASSSLD